MSDYGFKSVKSLIGFALGKSFKKMFTLFEDEEILRMKKPISLLH